MQIRTGRADDAEAALALWAAAGSVPSVSDDVDAVRGLIEHDPAALLVAEVDGAMVGTLIVGWDGWRGSFYRLAVHPDHRRSRIAEALVRAGEQRLEALGCRRVGAIVMDEHDHAVGFWSAVGYTASAAQSRYTAPLGVARQSTPSTDC